MPKKAITQKERFYVTSVTSIYLLVILFCYYLLDILISLTGFYDYQEKINVVVGMILLSLLHYGVALNGMKSIFEDTYEGTYYPQHYLSIVLIALGVCFLAIGVFHIIIPFVLFPIINSTIFLISGFCLRGNAKNVAAQFEMDKYVTY